MKNGKNWQGGIPAGRPARIFFAGIIFLAALAVFLLAADVYFQKTAAGKKLNSLLSPGSITVETVPGGAAVSIFSEDRCVIEEAPAPLNIRHLLPGEYRLVFKKEEFEPCEGRLKIGRQKEVTVDFEGLHFNLPGKSAIKVRLPLSMPFFASSAPQGASVSIDGEFAGKTPAEFRVKAGKRVFEAFFENKEKNTPGAVIRRPLEIIPGRDYDDGCISIKYIKVNGIAAARVQIVFRADFSVNSSPPGASVYLDGSKKSAGVTPLEGAGILPGYHRVTLKRRGYRQWSGEVKAPVSGKAELRAVLSKKIKFSSYAASLPGIEANASVEIEGTKIKKRKTPFACYLEEGEYTVKFSKTGHAGMACRVVTGAAEEIRACFPEKAEPERGSTLIVDARPGYAGAKIFVDGKEQGDTLRKISNLKKGMYTVTVKHPGFSKPASRQVEFKTDAARVVLKLDEAGNLYEQDGPAPR